MCRLMTTLNRIVRAVFTSAVTIIIPGTLVVLVAAYDCFTSELFEDKNTSYTEIFKKLEARLGFLFDAVLTRNTRRKKLQKHAPRVVRSSAADAVRHDSYKQDQNATSHNNGGDNTRRRQARSATNGGADDEKNEFTKKRSTWWVARRKMRGMTENIVVAEERAATMKLNGTTRRLRSLDETDWAKTVQKKKQDYDDEMSTLLGLSRDDEEGGQRSISLDGDVPRVGHRPSRTSMDSSWLVVRDERHCRIARWAEWLTRTNQWGSGCIGCEMLL